MKQNPYIGHSSQICAIEEVRLVGGKGDGMRLFQVRNESGMELTISADRCADISRLVFKGHNMGYFSPCGYVAPSYYDKNGAGFLKSFTAGFLTTCGLHAVGSPCVDDGEELPMHGSISNTPCEHIWWTEDEEFFYIHAVVNDATLFDRKFVLERKITCGKRLNQITITDRVHNQGDTPCPLMIMYHMNMGYPLLSENAIVDIHSEQVVPRNAHAAKDVETCSKMLKPTPGFEEQCYYHKLGNEGYAAIYNPDIQKGLSISFDPKVLTHFTEWKMMGYRDYALGLEPGNCYPDGRDVMRKQGMLQVLQPNDSATFGVTITLFEEP